MTSIHSRGSIDDPLQRRIYEYVEENGAATESELVRSIELESDATHSKPARSGANTHAVRPTTAQIRAGVDSLRDGGYLTEGDGVVRLDIPASPRTLDLERGTATVRPAREADREELLETMRRVARDGSYVVAANVAQRVERDSAVVRVDGDRSRICFVATLASGDAEETASEDGASDDGGSADGEAERDAGVVGWFHLEAPEHASRAHTAEVTVGVDPAFRGRGIGSALLAYGTEWAADGDYHKLTQGVPATDERAIEFLTDGDWHREGQRADQYRIDDDFVDEVLLATWPGEPT